MPEPNQQNSKATVGVEVPEEAIKALQTLDRFSDMHPQSLREGLLLVHDLLTANLKQRIEELEGELATSQKLVVALEERWGIRREEADDLRGRLEGARSEREDWRGKAEHRLNEWRLRDADVHEAATTADEAEAAKEMWRRRAESAEQRLEEATKALIELIGLRRWLEGQAGRMPDQRADDE